MAKFHFRLEKVLQYRANREAAAKNAYLGKRSEVLSCEHAISETRQRRLDALSEPRTTLDDLRGLEDTLSRFDDLEREQHVVLSVLNDEAETLLTAWTKEKQDLETINKLKERALAAWRYDVFRREQAELDEWAVLRSAA